MPIEGQDEIVTESMDVVGERLEELNAIFPELFSEGRIDFDKLRTVLGDVIDDGPERYSFSWAGKRDSIRLLQSPSHATLDTDRESSVNFDATENLFIEGDNLEVLKLLYKPYFGRVKMIYIDPPYNTGNDFVYPDNFADPLDTYLKLTGQKDTEGNLLTSNAESGGRYHSSWLSMMYPRLFLARQLLRDDGVIFVSIDDHEVHNLRLLMNDIFGEENFLACFIWHRRQMADSRNEDRASTDHEYVISYRKSIATLRGNDVDLEKYQNPDNDPRGAWFSADVTGLATRERRPNLHYDVVNPKTGVVYPPSPTRGWSCSKAKFQSYIEDERILWPSKPDGRPRLKKFLNEVTNFQTGFSSMLKIGFTTEGTREIQELFGEKIFQFPKPVSLIKTLAHQATEADDIILDFFAGSGTTAQAVLELNREDGGNRQFICVQLPEPTGNSEYSTIADISRERIRRVIAKMQEATNGKLDVSTRATPEELGFKSFKLVPSHFRQWKAPVAETDAAEYIRQMEMLNDPLLESWTTEQVIYETALKEGYSLTSRIERIPGIEDAEVWCVTDNGKEQSFLICLDNVVNLDDLNTLNLTRGDLFICRGIALGDTAAANLALQCRLKTI